MTSMTLAEGLSRAEAIMGRPMSAGERVVVLAALASQGEFERAVACMDEVMRDHDPAALYRARIADLQSASQGEPDARPDP